VLLSLLRAENIPLCNEEMVWTRASTVKSLTACISAMFQTRRKASFTWGPPKLYNPNRDVSTSLDMTHSNGHSDPALPERNLACDGHKARCRCNRIHTRVTEALPYFSLRFDRITTNSTSIKSVKF